MIEKWTTNDEIEMIRHWPAKKLIWYRKAMNHRVKWDGINKAEVITALTRFMEER